MSAMLNLALFVLILNLAGCQSFGVQNNGYGLPSDRKQFEDMIYAICATMCRGDQTNNTECHNTCQANEHILDEQYTSQAPVLVCRNNTHLTVAWSGNKLTNGTVYLAEIFRISDQADNETQTNFTLVKFDVVESELITFGDLMEDSDYLVRVTSFNLSGQLGRASTSAVLRTLTADALPGAPEHVWVENITLENNWYNAMLKWTPADDRACYYRVFVFADDENFLELEPIVPFDMFQKKINHMVYRTNYTVKIFAMTTKFGKESDSAWFSFETPSCLDEHRSLEVCLPPKPTGVVVDVELLTNAQDQADIPNYNIKVKWDKPTLLPNFYTVTLSINETKNQKIVSRGVETEFSNIKLDTDFFISIIASSNAGQSEPLFIQKDIRRFLSGVPTILTKSNTGTLLWAILVPIVLFISFLVIGVFVYHRHRKLELYKKRCRYFEELEQKAPKESGTGSSFTVPPEDDAFEINPDTIVLYEVLGEGAFGVVRKGWLPDQNREVAVKMLKDEPSAEEVKQFRQEMDMMKGVGRHAHIVSLVGCCTRPSATMMLVVEFCTKGDLRNYLRWTWETMASKSNGKPLVPSDMKLKNSTEENSTEPIKYAELVSSENSDCNGSVDILQPNLIVNKLYELQSEIKENENGAQISDICDITAVDLLSFGRQIAMGMEFLSSNRVVHRDLAARNVLVCSDKTVKIADFGLSRDIYQENMYRKTGTGKLPIKWMALESLTHQIYTTQSDVWSFGILLWEIVTLGANPYPSIPTSRLTKLLQSGFRMECPANCSHELYSLMQACWQARPKDRPCFSEIRQHLDKLLDGVCAQAYLSLDVMDYRDINSGRNNSTDQQSRSGEINQTDKESERYVRPISMGKSKQSIFPVQQNLYISQPASMTGYSNSQNSLHLSFTTGSINQYLMNSNNSTIMNDSSFIMYPKNHIEGKILNGNSPNGTSVNNKLGSPRCKSPQSPIMCAAIH